MGLTLHPIDPIDPPKTETEANEAANVDNAGATKDLTSTLFGFNFAETSNTDNGNREVQDILGDFQLANAPALPPKTSTSGLNRPSSVQREKISSSLIALPRPPSRLSQSSGVALSRPRGSPSPALGSSPKESNTLKRFSSNLSRQESESPSRKVSTESFDMMKTPSFGLSRGPSPLTLGKSILHFCLVGDL